MHHPKFEQNGEIFSKQNIIYYHRSQREICFLFKCTSKCFLVILVLDKHFYLKLNFNRVQYERYIQILPEELSSETSR